MNEDGVITIASELSVRETADRLESIVASHGFTVFARIDHAANAIKIGMELRPTELIIFGNPKVGTLLMQDKQTIQHDLGTRSDASIETIETVLTAVSEAAATR